MGISWYVFGGASKSERPPVTGVESAPALGDKAIANDLPARTQSTGDGETQDGPPWNDDLARELSQIKGEVNQLEAEVHQLDRRLGSATEPDSLEQQKRDFNNNKTIRPPIKEQ